MPDPAKTLRQMYLEGISDQPDEGWLKGLTGQGNNTGGNYNALTGQYEYPEGYQRPASAARQPAKEENPLGGWAGVGGTMGPEKPSQPLPEMGPATENDIPGMGAGSYPGSGAEWMRMREATRSNRETASQPNRADFPEGPEGDSMFAQALDEYQKQYGVR